VSLFSLSLLMFVFVVGFGLCWSCSTSEEPIFYDVERGLEGEWWRLNESSVRWKNGVMKWDYDNRVFNEVDFDWLGLKNKNGT
jgi:hypothetical protein